MKRLALLVAAFLPFAATPAFAEAPGLAVYVTDENKDVYVALYPDAAVELAGCPSETAARALIASPSVTIEQTTLAELQATHDLNHPKIPCSAEAKFDADFPATTPVWFDLSGTLRYYLPAPAAQGAFYSIPSHCTGIKEALAVRQRIALPGVLQAETAPPQGAMTKEIVLDCGDGLAGPIDPGDGGAHAGDFWSLHQTDVFLSEASVGDTIYVAIFNRITANGIEKDYLPIYRINGAPAGQAVWEGSNSSDRVEKALADLFGIDPALPVTTLGFQDVAKLDRAAYLDLCLTSCDGYRHQQAFFPQPGQAFELVVLPEPFATPRLGPLGDAVYRWEYADGRGASFVGCDRLAAAMGLTLLGAQNAAWGDAVDAMTGAAAEKPLVCSPQSDLCRRTVPEGGLISQALFTRSGECQSARRLRLELPKESTIAATLALDANGFDDVEIAPQDPVGRSRVKIAPTQFSAVTSACPFEPAVAVLSARNISRLRVSRLDIVRAAEGPTQDLTAMVLENLKAGLDHVSMGAAGDGLRPIERDLRLCNAELYTLGGSYVSELLGIHGLNSRVLIGGVDATDMTTVTSGTFGLFLMSGSTVRMMWTTLTAPRALYLRASELKANRIDMAAGQASATSSALRLERGASALLSVSSARGFACLGVFPDAMSTARFTLPTNALSIDNTRVNCGSGAIEIID